MHESGDSLMPGVSCCAQEAKAVLRREASKWRRTPGSQGWGTASGRSPGTLVILVGPVQLRPQLYLPPKALPSGVKRGS